MYLSVGFRADVKFTTRRKGRSNKTPLFNKDPNFRRNVEFPYKRAAFIPPPIPGGKKSTKMEIIFLDNLINSPTFGDKNLEADIF